MRYSTQAGVRERERERDGSPLLRSTNGVKQHGSWQWVLGFQQRLYWQEWYDGEVDVATVVEHKLGQALITDRRWLRTCNDNSSSSEGKLRKTESMDPRSRLC